MLSSWKKKKRVSPNKRDMQRLEKEKSISAFLSCCLDSCKPSPLTEVNQKDNNHELPHEVHSHT